MASCDGFYVGYEFFFLLLLLSRFCFWNEELLLNEELLYLCKDIYALMILRSVFLERILLCAYNDALLQGSNRIC